MEFTASNMARLTMADSRSPNAAGEAAATAFASQSVTVSAPATPAQPTQQSIAPAAATARRAHESDRVYSTDSVSFICPPSAGHAPLHFAAWLHRSPYAALADRHRRHPPRVGERHGLAPPGARATVNLGGTSAHTAHGECADRGDERNSVTHLLHMAVRSTSPPSQVIISPPGESHNSGPIECPPARARRRRGAAGRSLGRP